MKSRCNAPTASAAVDTVVFLPHWAPIVCAIPTLWRCTYFAFLQQQSYLMVMHIICVFAAPIPSHVYTMV